MKRSRRKQPSPSQTTPLGWYMPDERKLEVVDASEPEVKALVWEYGYGPAMEVCRQLYGHWDEARKVLEARRKALQVNRWENIR